MRWCRNCRVQPELTFWGDAMDMHVNRKMLGAVLMGALAVGSLASGCQTAKEATANAEPALKP